MNMNIRKELHEAVTLAIKEIGLEKFKKTSFFMSNDRGTAELKHAA